MQALKQVGRSRAFATRSALTVLFSLLLVVVAGCGGSADGRAGDGGGGGSKPWSAKIATASHSMAGTAVFAGFALGIYAEEGINLEDVPTSGSSTNVVSAVLSGDTEFGFLGGTTAVDAIAKGAPIKILGGVTFGMQQLVLRPDVAKKLAPVTAKSPVNDRVEALRGFKIATSTAGSANNAYLIGILKAHGLNPERDVTIVPSEPSAIVAGLRDGLYDGGFWSVGVLEQNLADKSGLLWIDVPGGDLPQFKQSFQAVTITSNRTLAKKPELVEAFVSATKKSAAAIGSDEEKAKAAIKEKYFTKLDAATYDLAWEGAKPAFVADQMISEEDFANHLKLQASLLGGNYQDVSFTECVYKDAQRKG